VSGETRSVAACALDTDPFERPERAHPHAQPGVLAGGGPEDLGVEQPPDTIDDRCDMGVLVGVDATDDNVVLFDHAGICLPSCQWDGHHQPGRRTGR